MEKEREQLKKDRDAEIHAIHAKILANQQFLKKDKDIRLEDGTNAVIYDTQRIEYPRASKWTTVPFLAAFSTALVNQIARITPTFPVKPFLSGRQELPLWAIVGGIVLRDNAEHNAFKAKIVDPHTAKREFFDVLTTHTAAHISENLRLRAENHIAPAERSYTKLFDDMPSKALSKDYPNTIVRVNDNTYHSAPTALVDLLYPRQFAGDPKEGWRKNNVANLNDLTKIATREVYNSNGIISNTMYQSLDGLNSPR